MTKETYQQKKIKTILAMMLDRGREYYCVKQMQDEVYIGKPYSDNSSPRGHQRAEDWARRRSKENNMIMEIYWTSGPPGLQKSHQLVNWRLYKIYENGELKET